MLVPYPICRSFFEGSRSLKRRRVVLPCGMIRPYRFERRYPFMGSVRRKCALNKLENSRCVMRRNNVPVLPFAYCYGTDAFSTRVGLQLQAESLFGPVPKLKKESE